MTERKILYMDPTYGYHVEQDTSSDTWNLYGVTIGAGNLALAGNRITGIPDTPTDGQDAVNQNYVDNAVTGIKWKDPVEVLTLVGNATVATINGLTPTAGDAYVVTDSGTITLGSISANAGDIVEFDGTVWVRLTTGSGGFVPDGTRAILSFTTALISPYTDATDDGKIVSFDGTSNTGSDTGEALDGNAVLVQDDAHVGYYDNLGYVFEGTVPTGTWIQFTGAGTVNAGAGLAKSGNTIYIGNGDGIQVNADSIEVDLDATDPGLEFNGASPDGALRVKVDGSHGIIRGTSGLEIEIDDTPDTLDVDADGLKVVGLPSLFKINDVAVGATVTAANLDDLTDGSNADSLHVHSPPTAVDEAKRVEDTHTNNVAVTSGQVVRWSGVNNQITPAANDTAANSRAIGIARTGGSGDPGTSEVVKHGVCAGCLTAATVNTPYFLGAAGARVVFASIPTPGRVVRLGYAVNATDLDVQIMDLGYKR